MKRLLAALFICLPAGVMLAQTGPPLSGPAISELPSKPFFIKQTWTIGGEGNWDYMAFDDTALQLFVAHGPVVQVVDAGAGRLAGQVIGLRDAHGIALDDNGQFGYISDGPADEIAVFDRRSFQVVARVPTGPNPRAVVFDPATRLVFAICTQPVAEEATRTNARETIVKSVVTVIDADTRTRLADLLLQGKLGFAQADGRGQVFINITDRSEIAYFDAQGLADPLRKLTEAARLHANGKPLETLQIDWTAWHSEIQQGGHQPSSSIENRLRHFRLGQDCQNPRGLAVDAAHGRLFTTCDNRRMEVMNASSGQVIASLAIGLGTDAVAYDANHGLIFTANGGGLGSVTVIRQTVSDSYAVVQTLPTKQRARTLAVNSTSGEVYLVTNLMGFDLNQKGTPVPGDVPVVRSTPVKGSFQVLVIGN